MREIMIINRIEFSTNMQLDRKISLGPKMLEPVHDSTMHVVSVAFVNRSRGV